MYTAEGDVPPSVLLFEDVLILTVRSIQGTQLTRIITK